jgi:hypothetical protein
VENLRACQSYFSNSFEDCIGLAHFPKEAMESRLLNQWYSHTAASHHVVELGEGET